MSIFHKTEIKTVILRCLMSVNLNWYKSYDTECKNTNFANVCFWPKSQKNKNGNICSLCHNLWNNQNLDPLSTSKWPSEPQFCERWMYSWQKNGQKWSYNGHTFFSFILNMSLSKARLEVRCEVTDFWVTPYYWVGELCRARGVFFFSLW